MTSHSDSELGCSNTKFLRFRTFKAKTKVAECKALLPVTLPKSFIDTLKEKKCTSQEQHLLKLVMVNNVDGVQRLLENGVNANCRDQLNRTPLHMAASRSYTEMVRLLLEYGANPNYQDIIWNTPLHLAACNNNLPLIKLLIDGGADLRSLNMVGRNPLQIAESKLRLMRQQMMCGFAEIRQIKNQVQEIVDIMISMWTNREKTMWGHHRENVEDLELMKLSLKSPEEQDVDDQVGKLLTELEQFSFK